MTIQNASVRTLQATIKAMQIGNKQVTLSMFRQMDSRPVLNHDEHLEYSSGMSIDYEAIQRVVDRTWGRVNYCPDKCDNAPTHLHVVESQDDKIYRSTFRLQFKDFEDVVTRDMAEKVGTAFAVHHIIENGVLPGDPPNKTYNILPDIGEYYVNRFNDGY